MYCPQCGHSYSDGDHFCSACGVSLTGQIPVKVAKKGAHWPPILIMVLMLALSAVVYIATRNISPTLSAPTSETPWFTMNGNILYFNESEYTGSSELVIPETVDGQQVLEIGAHAFADCEILTTVYLPEGLQRISTGAFQNCTSLRGISIPSSVTKIGTQAFAGCTALEAINLSDQITFIGAYAFDSCNSLLYIFYGATYLEWEQLYNDFISPYTYVFCADGVYPQGGMFP